MQSWEAALVSIVLATGGVIVVRVGWLSARDRLSPQRVAGIRTPSTLANEKAWYTAQRAGSRATIGAGLVGVAAGIAGLVLAGPRPDIAVWVAVGGAIVVMGLAVGGAIRGIRAARKLVIEEVAEADKPGTRSKPGLDDPGPT